MNNEKYLIILIYYKICINIKRKVGGKMDCKKEENTKDFKEQKEEFKKCINDNFENLEYVEESENIEEI